jgi:hypothetical protein
MRLRVAVLTSVLTVMWSVAPLPGAQAQGTDEAAAGAGAYYTWLERYADPKPRVASADEPSDHRLAAAVGREEALSWGAWGRETLRRVSSWARSFWQGAASGQPSEVGEKAQAARSSDTSLGCFYHRDYYTHLPMFQGDNFDLPGSYEASEVYWKEFPGAFPPVGQRAPAKAESGGQVASVKP